MYRGEEKGKMKGAEEMLRMMMMKESVSYLHQNHQYDHQTMIGFSQSGSSSSFSGTGFGLYGDNSVDSWNVFDHQNINQGEGGVDDITNTTSGWSNMLFQEQNFDKHVDIGDLSKRFNYGMSINGTGNFGNDFFDFQKSGELLGGQKDYLYDSMGSFCSTNKHPVNPLYNDLCFQKEQIDYTNLCNMNRPSSNVSLGYSEQCGFNDVGVDRSLLSSLHGINSECDCSILKQQRAKSIPITNIVNVNHPLSPLPNSRGHESEDSFIIQGECLKYASEHRGLKGHKKKSRNEIKMERLQEKKPARNSLMQHNGESCQVGLRDTEFQVRGFSKNGLASRDDASLMRSEQNYVYLAAKDQLGCRYLQRIFDEGTSDDVQIIFNGIIHNIFELMKDPFGNYLVQKLLTVCSDEQRMQFVLAVTDNPGELVKTSRTTHGTRVVQKLIETMKTRLEISLVIRALQPGILNLMMDVNGNHVVQRCLHCLSKDHNKLIFDVASKHCIDIATHRYGCCVLNKCITYSTGKQREKLLVGICSNGLKLAQDPFGNYVVQFIIELKIASAAAMLLSQFDGHYVYLSRQKFGSHVVEKFLKCVEESRSRIINELVSEPHFDQLLQDPFANYVIQSALGVTKGSVRALLLQAVRPHMLLLRTSPYCKKIFSRRLLKK
ncbi:putative pumilio homolog 8, chloroplastic [Nicotiana tomentosiformis]|uniref:putative pumilio homolog 8, chloroplastic n=1 Tax=Nicotiana tomentosiformis TaxID=4098 RepID=UPI00051C4FD8|nr:putative pumilio homolog 8, chloroplastic [Nicotiana tomentosiformis]